MSIIVHQSPPPMDTEKKKLTSVLLNYDPSNTTHKDLLWNLAYEKVNQIASRFLYSEREGHTLSTGDLASEVYLKFNQLRAINFQNSRHFYAFVSLAIRRILIDHARKHNSPKRPGRDVKVTLNEEIYGDELKMSDIMLVDQLLQELEKADPDLVDIINLRYVCGFNCNQAAAMLNLSPTTIKRKTKVAKVLIKQKLEV